MARRLCASFASLALVATALACGGSRSQPAVMAMPSPDGCYVRVWDQPRFTGASDFINGPRRYAHLRSLPGDRTWKNQIKSMRLGPNAVAIAWSDEQFRGENALLIADSRRGTFPTLPLTIRSLDIRCLPPQAAE